MAARKESTGTSRGSSGKSNTKKSTATRKASTGRAGKTQKKSNASKNTGGSAKKRENTTAKSKNTAGDPSAGAAVRSEISILVALALMLFGTLSVFGLCGSAGAVVRSILFGVFGILAYIAPLLFFLAVMFFVSNLGNGKAMGKLVAALLIVPDLCGLIQLVVSPYVRSETLKEIYEAGTGGGWLGGAVKQGLCGVFDVVGAYLVLVLILLICLVVITEKSITRWLRAGGERFLGRARDDYDYRVGQNEENRARNARKKEEQRIRREERRRQAEERRRLEEERRRSEEEGEDTGRGQQPERKNRPRRTDHKTWGVEIGENTVFGDPDAEEKKGDPEEHEEDFTFWPEKPKDRETVNFENPAPEGETEDTTVEWWHPHETGGPRSDSAMDPPEQGRKYPGESRPQKRGEEAQDEDSPEEETGDDFDAEAGDEDEDSFSDNVHQLDFMRERINRRMEELETVKSDGQKECTARSGRNDNDAGGMSPESYGEKRQGPHRDQTERESGASRKEDAQTGKSAGTPGDTKKEMSYGAAAGTDAGTKTASGEAAGAKRKEAPRPPYRKPPTSLLSVGGRTERDSQAELSRVADKLQDTLKRFGVNVTITDVSRGPSVTRYELLPEAGTRVSRITSLSDDIKLALAATDIRIEAPIPGKSAIGIEVPNKRRETVYLKELVESGELKGQTSKIAFAAGKDIAGKVVVADIAKMPHMLIAGTTGSGKSVFTNSIIMTILFRATPDEVKLIIIDPKVVEFGIYNGIPHLMTPVVTDPRKAAEALKWATAEMSRRYQTFANENVRDLKGYNKKIEREHLTDRDGEPLKKLPQIVIIIDELADLMMVAAKEVEETICRLAQLARAAGIHLIIATQRPSVDVVTGLIKANIPSRVALLVSSGTDSRTIIDMNGAEKLLGNGDMLFAPSGYAKPVRLQGAFVSDEEVRSVVEFLKQQTPEEGAYNASMFEEVEAAESEEGGESRNERDALFADAGRFLIEKKKASVSLLQRKFRIGFNRAARIIDQLEEAGVVGEEVGTKPRNVLMTEEEFEAYLKE